MAPAAPTITTTTTATVTSPNVLGANPSLQQSTNANVVLGTMSSVADLSRFNTDLVSTKNADSSGGTIFATMNPPPPPPDASVGGVVPGPGDRDHHAGVEEVPKSIQISGNDDIEDDLTVGTTVGVESGHVLAHREHGQVVPTTSPYFSNSWNNATDTTSKTAELTEKSKSTSVQGGGDIMFSNHPSSLAPRVSLSPPPPGGLNGPRPSSNNMNQAAYFSAMDSNIDIDDDNSIVIPGVPASIANSVNVDGKGATSGTTTVGGFGLRSGNQAESTNRNSQSNNMRASVERVGPTALLNSQLSRPASTLNATTQSALDHSSNTINSRGIGKFAGRNEKVKFTSTATNDTNGSNTNTSFKKSKVASFGAPLANSKDSIATTTMALNSTAITPDHRQGMVQNSVTSTPYSHGLNVNHGGAITPTPHKGPASAPTPVAAPTTTDFQPMAMEVEPQMKQTVETPPPPPRGRPRSQTIYSPTPSTIAESVTQACNVAMNPTTTAAPSSSNECFDDLLSEFGNYIQEGADIYERGQSDLLELEVDLSHAFAAVLRYKDEYTTLLSEIECLQAQAEHTMSEVSK